MSRQNQKYTEYDVADWVQHIMQWMAEDAAIYRGTKYLSDKFTVKVTRQHRPRANDYRVTYIVSAGRPNYAEREFIKQCKKVGEPFPVAKVQIKFYPTRSYKKAG